MVVIHRSRLGISITEVYFAEDPLEPQFRTDVVRYVRSASPGSGLAEARTLLIDLNIDEDRILSNCSKTTRYKIKRAIRDHVRTDFLIEPTVEQIEAFVAFYDVFARRKRRPLAGRSRLLSLKQAGALAISAARDKGGDELVWHAYVVDSEKSRAMLLLSASHFRDFTDSASRNSIGRANRCLYWMDMIAFRSRGFRLYDFGGLPQDDSDRELQQIGSFKRGFGGREVVEYSGQRGITLLGKLACLIKR